MKRFLIVSEYYKKFEISTLHFCTLWLIYNYINQIL